MNMAPECTSEITTVISRLEICYIPEPDLSCFYLRLLCFVIFRDETNVDEL